MQGRDHVLKLRDYSAPLLHLAKRTNTPYSMKPKKDYKANLENKTQLNFRMNL